MFHPQGNLTFTVRPNSVKFLGGERIAIFPKTKSLRKKNNLSRIPCFKVKLVIEMKILILKIAKIA
jgi:hypothetical protein